MSSFAATFHTNSINVSCLSLFFFSGAGWWVGAENKLKNELKSSISSLSFCFSISSISETIGRKWLKCSQ